MDDSPPTHSLTGRDVAGAWVFCAVIAALALGFASATQGGMPPVATVAAKAAPCASKPTSVCKPLTEAAGEELSTVAAVHRPTVPMLRPGGRSC
jgi:hypothetical protein